jgi:hypothetical protein
MKTYEILFPAADGSYRHAGVQEHNDWRKAIVEFKKAHPKYELLDLKVRIWRRREPAPKADIDGNRI